MNARTGFAVLLVGVLAVLCWFVIQPFLGYVLGAILLAFVLTPAQRRLAPVVGPRVASFALVGLAVVAIVGVVGALLTLGVTEVESIPTSIGDLPAFQPIQNRIERQFGVQVPSLVNRVFESVTTGIADRTSRLASAGVHAFLGLTLLVFLLYYLLKDGDDFVRWTKHVTPLPRDVQTQLYGAAEEATWAVLKGHVFVAILQGVVAGLGLFALGIPNAAFWTVVMMFLAMVPIVGVAPVLGGAVLYLAVNNRMLAAVGLFVYGMSAVAITDDYLRALVIDKESSLHSAVVLLGVFGAAYFLGAIGLFVGPIILALFKATVEVFTDYYDLPAY